MKLNLQNFEENLMARDERMPIGFSWSIDVNSHSDKFKIQKGDTVSLRVKPEVVDAAVFGDTLLVLVTSVSGDVVEGEVRLDDRSHDKILVKFNVKFVITCTKR